MKRKLSLLVWHRVEDLTATTAEETIRNRHERGDGLATLRREEHWRFAFDGDSFPAKLDSLVERSRLFVNPNKHAFRIVGAPEDERPHAGAVVRVRNREDIEGAAALEALRRRGDVEGLAEVVYETVWFLRFTEGVPAEEYESLAESYAVTRSRRDGLLVNPHFQEWSTSLVKGQEGVRMRHWKEECGVVGIANADGAAELVSLALYALQHRGQEGSGIVSFDAGEPQAYRGLGLVSDIYTADALAGLDGRIAVGHNRYSTTGSCSSENLQPIVAHSRGTTIALSHNGNLVNALDLRNSLEDQGAIFQTTMDSEVIVHLMARSRQHAFEDRVREALGRVTGAYSVILSDGEKLVGARDPRGFRPLCLGRLGDAHILASESCALDLLGAEYLREVEPGELVVIEGPRAWSIPAAAALESKHCIFEYIYFSRPDSVVFGHAVDPVRRRLGHTLAEEHPADADLVIAVPDSSNSAALGFAERSKIPFEIGLIRNHYVGRTFIQPTPRLRDLRVKIKYNAVKDVLDGKRVVVVDDSIVRGTTMKKLVKMLRKAGASEVHLRISSPPVQYPCFYGIDTPTRGELLAATHDVEQIRRYLEVEDVAYLSRESLLRAAPEGLGYCTACFDGAYPVPVDGERTKEILERHPV